MSVEFEVERFEWAADDRLELKGRWFGLRGRRFIRPTLDVEVNGESRRLLALMEHKPWQALDGEEWVAAFAWEGDRGDVEAELAVGSDLTFELPKPGGAPRRKARPKGATAAPAKPAQAASPAKTRPRQPSQAARRNDEALKRKLGEAERARTKALGETDALRRALEQKERTVRELQEQLTAAREQLEAAREQLEAARSDADADADAAAERRETSEAEVASAQPDAELEELRRERDAAIAARHAAIEQAEQAKRERYEAAGTLAAAEREAKAAARAVELAHAERDDLRATARNARHERDAAIAERDAALARLETTRRERDTAQLGRDAQRAERPQVAGVAEVVRRRGPFALTRLSADRTDDEALALRFAALVALSVVCALVGFWFLVA